MFYIIVGIILLVLLGLFLLNLFSSNKPTNPTNKIEYGMTAKDICKYVDEEEKRWRN